MNIVFMEMKIIYKVFSKINPVVIHDGPNKNRLFIDGMQKEDVKKNLYLFLMNGKKLYKRI